jgi:hypothetical protein
VGEVLLTVERLRELLLDDDRVSLDGEREDETYVLEHRGRGWLAFLLERGRKREARTVAGRSPRCGYLLAETVGGTEHMIDPHLRALCL